jgi:YVTN family beta-propeller protein
MVALTKDGRTIVTANITSNNVSIIQQDPAGTWTQAIVAVGQGPEGFDISPDGRELWVAHSRDGGVSVVDLPSKKVSQTITVGTKRSNRLKITPDGKFALISDLDAGELVVLDVAARKEIKRMAIGKMLEGILIPNNQQAFVAVTGENYVAVVDLKSWQVTRKIPAGAGPDGMAWVP